MKSDDVKTWLGRKGIGVCERWLVDCIDYFLSENQQMPLEILQNNVFVQWTLADLNEMGLPCLPNIDKATDQMLKAEPLEGYYVLQIESMMDISTPAFNQLEQIYKLPKQKLEEEFEKQEKSSRMLKLELTDGRTKINAIEYRPVKCLKSTLKPGTKVVLTGPIKMGFNGVFCLEEKNISILGGEVDCLIENNSLINTLLKSLGINPQDNPLGNLQPDIPNMNNVLDFRTNESEALRERSLGQVTRNEIATSDENMMDFLNDSNELFHDFDDNLEPDMLIETVVRNEMANARTRLQINILDSNYPIKFNDKPLIYVKQLKEIYGKIATENIFVLLIKIEEFVEKLCVRNDTWHNLVRISDSLVQTEEESQDSINAVLHSDVITQLSGYSAKDMLNLQKQISQDPDVKQDIINRLRAIKDRFESELFLAKVKVFPLNSKTAVIIQLEEFKEEHRRLVESKLKFD